MSTRANIVVSDGEDDYPDGTLPTLKNFIALVQDGIIHDNISQACGWLVLIGARDYGVTLEDDQLPASQRGPSMGWKVGAYEPTTGLHSDIEYIYVVDLKNKCIKHRKVKRDAEFNSVVFQSFYCGRFNPVKRRHSGTGKAVNGATSQAKPS